MPGHRCIAPGCNSGYDSCKEKYHFFTVPKDDNKLQQWKKAISRKNFEIKPCQVVCERHFHEPIARLVNLKSKGGLIHPNINFFNFICKIEQLFSKYYKMADVFELILTDLLDDTLYFPCF